MANGNGRKEVWSYIITAVVTALAAITVSSFMGMQQLAVIKSKQDDISRQLLEMNERFVRIEERLNVSRREMP